MYVCTYTVASSSSCPVKRQKLLACSSLGQETTGGLAAQTYGLP